MTLSKRIAAWVLGLLAVLVALAVALLPLVTGRLLEGFLREKGATEVSIGNVNVNIFTGDVALYDLLATSETRQLEVGSLEAHVALWPLLSRRVEVLDVTLEDSHLDVVKDADGTWYTGPVRLVTGGSSAPSAEPSAAWEIGAHKLIISDATLSLTTAAFTRDFEIDTLSVLRAFSWKAEKPLDLEIELSSEAAELRLEATATPSDDVIDLVGEIELDNVILHEIQAPALKEEAEQLKGRLQADLEFDAKLARDTATTMNFNGEVELADLTILKSGALVVSDTIAWQGGTTLALQPEGVTDRLSAHFSGNLELAGLGVAAVDDNGNFLDVAALDAVGLVADLQGVAIRTLTFSGVEANVRRLAGGGLQIPGESGKSEGTPPYSVRIAMLTVEDDSIVTLTDEAVEPVFTAALVLEELQLQDINTADPEKSLSLRLAARSSETDELIVTGTLAPFAEALSADLEVMLAGFDLSQLSPYLPGYNIVRGRLNLQGRHQVIDGEFELNNKVIIEALKLDAMADDKSAIVTAGKGMPMDVILDLLRHSDGRIEVDIPITGRLGAIDVELDELIRQATAAAMEKAAFAYVKKSLQPLGTILFVADLIGKATRPRFESVTFSAGDASLIGFQSAYVKKIAGMLADRPGLQLTLCGVATESDRVARSPAPEPGTEKQSSATPAVTEEMLLALARSRADLVKHELITSSGAEAEQLYDCQPSIDSEEGATPRVEIML